MFSRKLVLLSWSSFLVSAGAFVPPAHNGHSSLTPSASSLSCARTRSFALATKTNENNRLTPVKLSSTPSDKADKPIRIDSKDEWDRAIATAVHEDKLVIAEFRHEFCRKCMALAAKYSRMPALYAGKNIMFLEIDAQRIGKELRTHLGVNVVPTVQLWKNLRKLEVYEAEKDLSKFIPTISEMISRHQPDCDQKIVSQPESKTSTVEAQVAEVKQENEEPQFTKIDQDAFSAWKMRQSSTVVVRAPGISEAKGTSTLLRSLESEHVNDAPKEEKHAPAGNTVRMNPSKGGMSAAELREQLEKLEKR
uniref:Thioredoxin domain-containing protein n=1 Tax=Hanusia phi TaxID=3032 RepID=A0A7S0E5A6_9CRYP|mmetsp:Transcript_16483/g.37634  ORF Transcript_16483/g.37634 Transcript_16483/m.37634 type:complete len:307 (+) Transcript_16483:60-980(+)